jgi:hypothetical protein
MLIMFEHYGQMICIKITYIIDEYFLILNIFFYNEAIYYETNKIENILYYSILSIDMINPDGNIRF